MFLTRKPPMQQADAAGGGKGAGAGTGAGAGGAGDAGAAGAQGTSQQQGAGQQQGTQQQAGQQQQQQTTNTTQGQGDTSQQWKPTAFVPKLPEGKTIDKDPILKEYFSEFNAVFADEKLSTAGKMQALVDLQGKYAQKAIAAQQKQRQEEADRIAAQPARDLETLKNDKTFGGPNFQATVDGAKRIETYAFGEDLGKLLGPLGMQSDPVIIRGLARLARVISGDAIGTNTGRNTQQVDEMAALFPKSIDKMRQSQRKPA